MNQEFFANLKIQLDQAHSWPCIYLFKFIVPSEQQQSLLPLLPPGEIEDRSSKNGKYISLSLKAKVENASQVIEVYQRVAVVPGIISL